MNVEGLVPSPGEAALLCTGFETLAPLWWAGWWETCQPQSLKQGERRSSQSWWVRRNEESFRGTTQRPVYDRSLNITLFVFPLMINLINPSTPALLSQLVYQGATDLSQLSTTKSTCSTWLPEAMLKTKSWVKCFIDFRQRIIHNALTINTVGIGTETCYQTSPWAK